MRRKKQTSRKIIITVIVIAILAAVGFCAYKIFFEKKPEAQKPQSESQEIKPEEEKQAQKQEDNQEGVKKPIQKYEGNNPNEGEKLTGVITYAGATSNNIIIRVNIDQYVDGGSCELKLIKNDKIEYQETSNLIADVATSTCEGFNISRSKIENGNYIIRIDLKSNEKTGSISGELNL